MNIGKRKLLRGLTSFLIGIAAITAITGCENHKDLKLIEVNEVVMSYDYEDSYGVAIGVKHFFIVYGEYKGFHEGEALDPINGTVNSYSIKDLLDKYPNLNTPEAQKAATRQGNTSKP